MKGRMKLALLAVGVASGVAQADEFQITIENLGPQPLSPLFYSAGDNQFDIFDVGGSASLGIKKIAEGGDTSAMLSIASAAAPHSGTFGVVGASPLAPGGTVSSSFSTDLAHGFFSFAAMLGKTNDGFIGESLTSLGLNLYNAGTPQGFSLLVTGARAWDAGTEKNTQNAADLGFLGGSGNPAEDAGSNTIRVHGGVIPNVGDSWNLLPSWSPTQQLARITVAPVPEPATMIGLGLGALALLRRRRSHAS
jgi:hypothetical protein